MLPSKGTSRPCTLWPASRGPHPESTPGGRWGVPLESLGCPTLRAVGGASSEGLWLCEGHRYPRPPTAALPSPLRVPGAQPQDCTRQDICYRPRPGAAGGGGARHPLTHARGHLYPAQGSTAVRWGNRGTSGQTPFAVVPWSLPGRPPAPPAPGGSGTVGPGLSVTGHCGEPQIFSLMRQPPRLGEQGGTLLDMAAQKSWHHACSGGTCPHVALGASEDRGHRDSCHVLLIAPSAPKALRETSVLGLRPSFGTRHSLLILAGGRGCVSQFFPGPASPQGALGSASCRKARKAHSEFRPLYRRAHRRRGSALCLRGRQH